jgi:prepilin-type N-terminal cleavage/methylation domain-containing protein
MKIPRTNKGFTLIELLVVIGIIALLASIALPAFASVQVKAAQTKALNNAKQIGFACRAFGTDNNGQYPNYPMANGSNSSTSQVSNSNDAFNDLIPTYLSTIQCFYQGGSAETPLGKAPPDPSFAGTGGVGSQSASSALPSGKQLNHWAYETGMSDTANSTYPLITNNPATATSPVTWAANPTVSGGVWKGKQAIVVHVDDSASVDQLNSKMQDMNGPNGIDLFSNSNQDGSWMYGTQAAGNNLVQPN